MTPFTIHRGTVAPLMRRDIDTDQIIPKQFLTATSRSGFGRGLFHDWRHDARGAPVPGFVLNEPRYAGATILVTGENFGCGSSREHAVWALADAGFRVVIAPSFADIFAANALTNGLLTVAWPAALVDEVARRAGGDHGYALEVDLRESEARDAQGLRAPIVIEPSARDRLMRGLDTIDLILEHEDAIARYEINAAR
ncbi:MAG: 3-isopropylmalate dehydratase small subunit [Vicinamibacterales bacterium]|nr:3-isopropylmalate dehydratase small subunit [Vicinamibacterales bacterium]